MNIVIKSFCCFQRLFDPINPDKDTIQTRVWTRQERLDKEYLVLQRLEDILEKANFSELPPSMVNKALEEHSIGDGIKVNKKNQTSYLRENFSLYSYFSCYIFQKEKKKNFASLIWI